MNEPNPCTWPGNDRVMLAYHDLEWGKPKCDDHTLLEYLVLETFQAGLSWRTILHKRKGFRKAFLDYDPNAIASMTEGDEERLMQDASIIRNRLKIKAAITNAQHFIAIQQSHGSFSNYLWTFVAGKTVVNDFESIAEIPANTPLSDSISADLKKRGFKFVGSTIIYAFLQAVGIVNDHLVGCPARGV